MSLFITDFSQISTQWGGAARVQGRTRVQGSGVVVAKGLSSVGLISVLVSLVLVGTTAG